MTSYEAASNPAIAEVKRLMLRKDTIEKEIDQIWATLNSPACQQVGRDGSLLDSEGFPRSDIDHYLITSSRQRLTVLENDLKGVMNSLERGLENLHQIARDTGTITKGQQQQQSRKVEDAADIGREPMSIPQDRVINSSYPPFACVSEVAPGSPAAEAGLLDGDRIVDFGGAKKLKDLPSRVQAAVSGFYQHLVIDAYQASSGSSLSVEIQRPGGDGFRSIELDLRPREWSGRGVLGCLVTPL
ncbi:26S proteasome non-ATPase regulatory subunit 9 [Perkinsus olseni]|uniref:26S proteasome non-ATPase regulatory subunit 9 n=2 Tax=Perkinsus olseni TaxID=32597 RepID=A0A7J6Q0H1_PEROL|nr:26S proteasome non-ATPase regulatory subunit 9 [Perkinsus olseni]